MSCSPSCQCMASAARQGTAISSATLDHISGLNLEAVSYFRERNRVKREFEGMSRGKGKLADGVLPLVKSCELVLALFVPFAASFKVILIVKPTANCAASWKSLGNVFPLHSTAPKLDDQRVLFGGPLALLLGWRLCWVRRHAALATRAAAGEGIGWCFRLCSTR